MQEDHLHTRKIVVPDASVKLLDLCLGSDENGILMPTANKRTKNIEYGKDCALKDLIAQRLNNHQKSTPLNIRKKEIYDECLEESEECSKNKNLEEFFTDGVVPIVLRKYLLHQQYRAC